MFRIITEHASKGMQLSSHLAGQVSVDSQKGCFHYQSAVIIPLLFGYWPFTNSSTTVTKNLFIFVSLFKAPCVITYRTSGKFEEVKIIIPLQTSPHTIVYRSVHLLSGRKYKSTIPVANELQDGPSPAGCFEQVSGSCQLAPRWSWHLCCLSRSV